MTKTQYAQGDLLFVKQTGKMPEGKAIKPENGRIILAYGEVTGHHHSLPAVAVMEAVRTDNDEVYFTLEELIGVDHQEHATITLEPGMWKVILQREATDNDEEWVRVTD